MKKTNLGYVLFSQQILEQMSKSRQFSCFIGDSLGRQVRCDWGSKKDINDRAYAKKYRISAMYSADDTEIMIITELDKNLMPRTTVVFPEEGGIL